MLRAPAAALLSLSALLAASGPALARDDRGGADRIAIAGTGTVTVTGGGVAYGTVGGGGTVLARDAGGGDLVRRIQVIERGRRPSERTGERAATRRGTIRFAVQGSSFVVRVGGRRVTLFLAGDARVVMRGRGAYRTDGGRTRRWSGRTQVTLGEGPPQPRRPRPQYGP